jgi:4-methylaminobutanoate oxidase (formaldehyde-forming)
VTFTGEHGWELYTSTEYAAGLWRRLVEAGEPMGLVPCGYRAIESLRLEMGYRVWSTDLTPETSPYEAGLGFCVKLDKPSGFVGRDALVAAREAGPTRRLCLLVLEDPRAVVLGSEPVRVADEVVGRVTSGGFGYTCGSSLAYAYLPVDLSKPGTEATINLFGRQVPAVVTDVRTLLSAD